MNPILLKPTGEQASQVVVRGRPWKTMSAREYHAAKPDAAAGGARRPGGPAPPLRRRDLRGRGEPGGDQPARPRHRQPPRRPGRRHAGDRRRRHQPRRRLRRAVRNGRAPARRPAPLRAWFRHQQAAGRPGPAARRLRSSSQARTRVPVLGVLPWLRRRPASTPRTRWRSIAPVGDGAGPSGGALADELDVAVVRLPRISNFTRPRSAARRAGRRLRFVHDRAGLGAPDLVILPGSKATVDDLEWLRAPRPGRGPRAGRRPSSSACAAATRCSAGPSTIPSSRAGPGWPGSGCSRSTPASTPTR